MHPHRDHGRKVERADTCDDTDRLAGGVDVDPGGHVVGVLALESHVDGGREVKGFPATLDLTDGVGIVLAMLLDDEPCHLVLMIENELTHPEHDGHSFRQRVARPLLLRLACHLDGVVQILLGRLQQFCGHLTSRRVLNGNHTQRGSLVVFTADPVLDGLHARELLRCRWTSVLASCVTNIFRIAHQALFVLTNITIQTDPTSCAVRPEACAPVRTRAGPATPSNRSPLTHPSKPGGVTGGRPQFDPTRDLRLAPHRRGSPSGVNGTASSSRPQSVQAHGQLC